MDIFIIEDDKSLSDEIKLVLNKWGYKVGQVNNFENITNEVLECNPKLILMDINLPSYDAVSYTHLDVYKRQEKK